MAPTEEQSETSRCIVSSIYIHRQMRQISIMNVTFFQQSAPVVIIVCLFLVCFMLLKHGQERLMDSRKLLAFEMRCYRRILKVRFVRTRVSNNIIREKSTMTLHSSRVNYEKRVSHFCRMKHDY